MNEDLISQLLPLRQYLQGIQASLQKRIEELGAEVKGKDRRMVALKHRLQIREMLANPVDPSAGLT